MTGYDFVRSMNDEQLETFLGLIAEFGFMQGLRWTLTKTVLTAMMKIFFMEKPIKSLMLFSTHWLGDISDMYGATLEEQTDFSKSSNFS